MDRETDLSSCAFGRGVSSPFPFQRRKSNAESDRMKYTNSRQQYFLRYLLLSRSSIENAVDPASAFALSRSCVASSRTSCDTTLPGCVFGY